MLTRVGTNNLAYREVWLEEALTRVPAGARILDAGAGELKYKRFCSHLDYVSQDFAQYDGTGDASGLHMGTWDQSRLDIVCDIIAIPEPDASFDAVMCIEVLEHLPNPLLALQEFSRLLRPGGHLILTAPFCSLTHFAPYHFCSGFNRYFYETHLPAHGLEIIELQHNGNFFEFIAQEVQRIKQMADRYTGKKVGILGRVLLQVFLIFLARYSRQDSGSHEVLNFGYHIFARKVDKQ